MPVFLNLPIVECLGVKAAFSCPTPPGAISQLLLDEDFRGHLEMLKKHLLRIHR